MKYFRWSGLWLLATLVLVISGIVLPKVVIAQGSAEEVAIAYSEAIAFNNDSLTLRVYFTPVDSNRKPVLNLAIHEATISLDPEDGGNYKAKVDKASGPIAIMLVLDTSGSMGRANAAMQAAALEMVNKGPQQARYAVIGFNDTITLLQDFTDDKNRLANAIAQAKVKPNGGTCLFDAALKGLTVVGASAASGRRAIVVFTDGVDELASGKPCSTSNVADVVMVATNKNLRIPMYTIGLQGTQGRAIATSELRQMAVTTGGDFAIGSDLPSLFKTINDALNAQLVAEAEVKPRMGEHTARIQVRLETGSLLKEDSTVFTSPKDYSFKTPTPTMTPTLPPPVTFHLDPPLFDAAARAYVVTVSGIISAEQIKSFRFELIGEDGLGKGKVEQSAPLAGAVNIPIPDLPAQAFTIKANALGDAGQVLHAEEAQTKYVPTATPTPTATNTQPPVGVILRTLKYENETKEAVIVSLQLLSPEKIDHLRVTIIDRGNQTRADIEPIKVAPEIRVPFEDIPAGEYLISVFAVSADGQQLDSKSNAFTHTRENTLTPSPSPTATPVVAVANLQAAVEIDREKQSFIFHVDTQNQDLIKGYRLEFINADTKESIKVSTFAVPPYDTITAPFAGLEAGKYAVQLRALDADGKPITEISQIEFLFFPPTPTPTMTPMPTATPLPNSLFDQVGRLLADPGTRLPVLGIFGVLAFGLLFILYMLLRRPAKAPTGTGFLSEMTGAVDISKLEGYAGKDAKGKAAPSRAPDATAPAVGGLDERTSAVPHLALPQATLVIEGTRDPAIAGQVVAVTHTPFTLGRRNRDLNFDGDDNVSRAHAEILYDNNNFYIQDNNSTHGTYVDERQAPPGKPVPLYDGVAIRLGTTTVLRFTLQSGGDFGGDPDRTSPEMPSYQQ